MICTNQAPQLYLYNALPNLEYPSWLHSMLASVESQSSSHTVPHTPFAQISTRPLLCEELPLRQRARYVVQDTDCYNGNIYSDIRSG